MNTDLLNRSQDGPRASWDALRSRLATACPAVLSAALLALAATPDAAAQQQRWAGYTVHPQGYATTAESFLGITMIARPPDQAWVLSQGVGSWFYLPEEYVEEEGSWAYSLELTEELYDFHWANTGWLRARNNDAWVWVYKADQALSVGHGWVYIHYGEPLPERLAIDSELDAELPAMGAYLPGHINARPADEAELERFEDALRVGPEMLEATVEAEAEVTVESGAEGITFTSTAFSGNRFVRLLYHPVRGGLIDLSALRDTTGEIGVTVRADVDLSADTGGFYSRIQSVGVAEYVEDYPGIPDYIREFMLGTTEVGSNARLEKGAVYEDVLLEMHTLEGLDPAWIELTLPPGASVTVKSVFFNMTPVIRGFAGLEEQITGGTGASAENTHTVTTVPEMQAALDAAQATDEPSIIYVDGLLSLDQWEGANGASQQFSVDGANISVIGVDANAILEGIGFKIHGTNIIMKNLTVREAWMQDIFEINDARYVHITQNTGYGDPSSGERFDEFISIKNQSRYVVISWNHLHSDPEGRGILIGSNDGVESLPDRSVIIHHNWFETTGSRHPLLRGGYVHMYNNFFDNVNWGANIRTRGTALIENNYYLNVGRAIFPGEEPPELSGGWEIHGNIFDGGNASYQPTESTAELTFEEDYTYELDPAEDVPTIVMEGAGARNPVE